MAKPVNNPDLVAMVIIATTIIVALGTMVGLWLSFN
jgi:hypothetical protein